MLKALEKKFQAVATKPPKECGEKKEIDEIANNRFNNISSIESISVSSTSLPIMATSSTSSSNRSKDVAEMPAQRNVLIRNFIPILFQNLTVMIGANVPENGFVKIENYLQQVSMMTKLNGDAVPFNEWFLSLPKLMCQKKLFCKLWNKGIIFYCCKKEAEELVTKNGPGTFMVRVSNTEFETFKITSLRRGKMEIEHYPCAFYGITEPLILQMKQHYCHLNAPNILKWSKNGTTKCVDFAKMLEKFDKSEYKNLLDMRNKEYSPNDGKGFRANIDYQRNQKPFGTDSYLRQRWKLWKK